MEDGLHHARIPEIGVNKQMIEFPLYAYTSTIIMPVLSFKLQMPENTSRYQTEYKSKAQLGELLLHCSPSQL